MDDIDYDALHSLMDAIEARTPSDASAESAPQVESGFEDAEPNAMTEEHEEREFLRECVRLTVAAEESLARGQAAAAPRSPEPSARTEPHAAVRKCVSNRYPAPVPGFSARHALHDRVSLKLHSTVSAGSCSPARTFERQASARKSAVRRSRRNSDAFDPIE